jgi:hypothetical protein
MYAGIENIQHTASHSRNRTAMAAIGTTTSTIQAGR